MKVTLRRVALGALAVWMVPLVAPQVVEWWNRGPGVFVFAYLLFFATGVAFAWISRRMNAWSYQAAVGLALVEGFVLGRATMVHLSETEEPLNFVSLGARPVDVVGRVCDGGIVAVGLAVESSCVF